MDPRLTLTEINRILTAGGDPTTFLALTADGHVDISGLAGTRDEQGREVLVVPVALIVPRDLFARGPLDAKGREPNPLQGACPVVSVRLVVQKAQLDPDVVTTLTQPDLPPLPVLRPRAPEN